MKSKSILLFLFISSLVTLGVWSIADNYYYARKQSLKDLIQLKASLKEYSDTGKKLHSNILSFINDNESTTSNEIRLNGTDNDVYDFYFWLKSKKISFAGDISSIYQELKSMNSYEELNNIKVKLASYKVKLIKRGVHRFKDREYIRNQVDSILNKLNKVAFTNSSLSNSQVNNSLKQKELIQSFDDNLRRLDVQRKYVFAQVANIMNLEGPRTEIFALFAISISLILSLFYGLLKNSKVEKVTKRVQFKSKSSAINEDVEAIFKNTKYPVLKCSKDYAIIWKNNFANQTQIDSIILKNLVQSLQTGKSGLNFVEFQKNFYHFSLNVINSAESKKNYLVQLIPTERPILGHNTIIDKSVLAPINRSVSKVNFSSFDINEMFSNILLKTNYLFQLTGTVIDFVPITGDPTCVVDRNLIEKNVKKLILEIHSLIKENSQIQKVAVELAKIDDRIFFNFVLPHLDLSKKAATNSEFRTSNIGERFLEVIDEIECSMAIARSRIILRNVQYKDIDSIVLAANVSFSVLNKDIRELFRNREKISQTC